MATLLLSAAGSAVGAGFGGTVLGLTGAVIGRAVGATLGRAIDQRLLGAGSEAVEVGRIDRLRLMGAGEGAPIPRVWGRMRVAGQVIWATRFRETATRSGGGKGAPRPRTTTFRYSVSLAVALCEGEILSVGRVWADGNEIAQGSLTLHVYRGTEDQAPDPLIETVEGVGKAPAYRGLAYVVIEDLDLSPYGNRVPQFNFEVIRSAAPGQAAPLLHEAVKGVCLIPGSGEYALATTPVHVVEGPGQTRSLNMNSASGKTDFETALAQLQGELPNCKAAALVVSWFGSDLRCAACEVRPKVEATGADAAGMPWRVAGLGRTEAVAVPNVDGRPVYGGTPADQSVIEAIVALRGAGVAVTFYPFVLMDQTDGNTLPDPWSDAGFQPRLPWRGRITLASAPGRSGTADRTAVAEAEVAAFFGGAGAGQFAQSSGLPVYVGPQDWGYRRFILHYAQLCKLAGGVDSFCIGSELVGLTRIRGGADRFPAVDELRALAAEVREILGPDTRIGYAADWTEYAGYSADGNLYFPLDPLWADANCDFVGIDNYMPIADWRDGAGHADAAWGSVHNIPYLKANILGGEGFDWYYDSPEGEALQIRRPIEDGAHGEPWVYRQKDVKSWWANAHHERVGASRSGVPTAWVPQSKPVRFIEYGCAAIDKGANQPNRFLDLKSSESALPRASNGQRDDFMQMQYLRAMAEFWSDEGNNPVSAVYGAPMLDLSRSHVWAWDVRPYPEFPAIGDLWSDGVNHARGHWLNGRASAQPLSAVLQELCGVAGLSAIETQAALGVVRGYSLAETGTVRAALQPLLLANGTDAVEDGGLLSFRSRRDLPPVMLAPEGLAVGRELPAGLERSRATEAEVSGRVSVGYVSAEGDYEVRVADAALPDDLSANRSMTEFQLLMTEGEARNLAERWLAEARIGRDGCRFALPPSGARLGAGALVELEGQTYRIDRREFDGQLLMEAVRVEPRIHEALDMPDLPPQRRAVQAAGPIFPLFLDLPLLTGTEVAHQARVAVAATPWPGEVTVWSSAEDAGYVPNVTADRPSVIGVTETVLAPARSGLWDRGPALRIRLAQGDLETASPLAVLNGANSAAIGSGAAEGWEVFQFQRAEIVGPGLFELSLRLRGQAGTGDAAALAWPVGSTVVLLDGAQPQVDMAASSRGLTRFYRFTGAGLGLDHPTTALRSQAVRGIGLRPYSPCHLRGARRPSGDIDLSWIRRTRVDGDSWESLEVPLGEDREAYLLRVLRGVQVLREVQLSAPGWTYPAGLQAADGLQAGDRVGVAQVSDRFGAGPEVSIPLPVG